MQDAQISEAPRLTTVARIRDLGPRLQMRLLLTVICDGIVGCVFDFPHRSLGLPAPDLIGNSEVTFLTSFNPCAAVTPARYWVNAGLTQFRRVPLITY